MSIILWVVSVLVSYGLFYVAIKFQSKEAIGVIDVDLLFYRDREKTLRLIKLISAITCLVPYANIFLGVLCALITLGNKFASKLF